MIVQIGHYLTTIDAVWPLVKDLEVKDGYHPFLIIDPRPRLRVQFKGLQNIMPRKVHGLSLSNRPFVGSAMDRTRPYVLVDVDAGLSLCNLDPIEARATILRQGRIPLSITEAIFLVANEFSRTWKAVGCLASREALAFIVFPDSGQGTVYPSCAYFLQ
ncbi:MAG: DUF5701 family protein [bacterium]|nr:DUF5701 family protein [bacterium]